jgi:hypothetical protein
MTLGRKKDKEVRDEKDEMGHKLLKEIHKVKRQRDELISYFKEDILALKKLKEGDEYITFAEQARQLQEKLEAQTL